MLFLFFDTVSTLGEICLNVPNMSLNFLKLKTTVLRIRILKSYTENMHAAEFRKPYFIYF
jgi:hypothetical protein